MFQKLLIATDLSDGSEVALRTGLELARALGAQVVILHVIEAVLEAKTWFLPDSAAVEAVRKTVASEADVVRDRLVAQVAAFGGGPAEVLVRYGRPGDEIPACAEEVGADLIVVGTHGRRGFQRAIMGEVASRVARTAGRAVLAIPRRQA